MVSKLLWLFPLGILTAALVWATRDRPSPTASAGAAEVEELRHQVDQLRDDVRRLEQQVASSRGDSPRDERGGRVPPGRQDLAAPARGPASASGPPERRSPVVVNPLEDTFEKDSPDARTSSQLETAILGALASRDGRVTPLGAIDCRTTACRFTIAERDAVRFNDLIPDLSKELAGQISEVSVMAAGDAGAARSLVVYMQRR